MLLTYASCAGMSITRNMLFSMSNASRPENLDVVTDQISVIVDILVHVQFPVHTALVSVWQHSPAAAALRMEPPALRRIGKLAFGLVRLGTPLKGRWMQPVPPPAR